MSSYFFMISNSKTTKKRCKQCKAKLAKGKRVLLPKHGSIVPSAERRPPSLSSRLRVGSYFAGHVFTRRQGRRTGFGTTDVKTISHLRHWRESAAMARQEILRSRVYPYEKGIRIFTSGWFACMYCILPLRAQYLGWASSTNWPATDIISDRGLSTRFCTVW